MSHSEIPHKPTISILGLGAMGTALAEAFIRQKYPVTVWNRSSAKAQPLVEKGATHATSVAKALENSETIIVCLLSQNVIEKTLQDSTSLFAGRTIVNLTNGTPVEAQNLNQFVTSHGGTYLQGGIMGVPAMVATEAMVILYSGNGDAYEKLESHLRVLGNGKFLGPDPGHASLHDQALLAGMYGLFMGFLQSISMIRAGAKYTSATQFTKELWTPWLTVMTAYCGHMAEQIDKKDYATQGSSLAMQLAAIDNIVKTSEGVGVDAELIKLMSKLMTGRVRQGGGAEDISSLVECMVSQDGAKH